MTRRNKYKPVTHEAYFFHDDEFDRIGLRLTIPGEIVHLDRHTDATCRPRVRQRGDGVVACVYFSSVFCPFKCLMGFLESVSENQANCHFSWDAEGPDGFMSWKPLVQSMGRFKLEWSSRSCSYEVISVLGNQTLVATLYGGFRQFVESDRYNPWRYERLPIDSLASWLLPDFDAAQAIQALTALDQQAVRSAFDQLLMVVSDQTRRPGAALFRDMLVQAVTQPAEKITCGFVPDPFDDWSSLSAVARAERIVQLFACEAGRWHGRDLRAMKSPHLAAAAIPFAHT